MTAAKWQVRYEQQVAANNLLSDRLRLTRKMAREREAQLISHIKEQREDSKKLLSEVLVLKATLLEAGCDPMQQDIVSDEEVSAARAVEMLAETQDGKVDLSVPEVPVVPLDLPTA